MGVCTKVSSCNVLASLVPSFSMLHKVDNEKLGAGTDPGFTKEGGCKQKESCVKNFRPYPLMKILPIKLL